MNLSPRVTLEQMIFSQTALRKGIDNTPNAGEIAYLTMLAQTIMEPMMDLLGVPIHIDSGFRSVALNFLVGGSGSKPGQKPSAHLDGRAVDFIPQGLELIKAFDMIRASGLPFDQVIIECNAWIHVGISRTGLVARHEALKASGGPGAWTYEEVK